MKHLRLSSFVLAFGVSICAGALAQTVSKDDYAAGKNSIAAEYKSASAACGSLSGNAKDICVAQAKGKRKVAQADLEARYKPTAKNRYDANIAKAEAGYDVAKERCDDLAGNPKDVCVKEAKAALVSAKADAKAQQKSNDARKDASADKSDAEFAVAKEKCDSLAGTAKNDCLNQAKAKYGK